MGLTAAQKKAVATLLQSVQDRLTSALEEVDGAGKFVRTSWQRPESEGQGGGTMAVLRSSVVEKAGVNISAVEGERYPALEGEHKGKPYFATGVSTICHMQNPFAPIGHMNVRVLEVGDSVWVGGGADMTPYQAFAEDTQDFHQSLEKACEVMGPEAYPKYKAWCDEYFYIPHRKSIRGVGGIFFDYVQGDFDKLLSFLTAVTSAYVETYPKILKRRAHQAFNDADKEGQLYWRGRYAEFNLVYDRGTKFGLMTGGNIEAIFVSLPPVVKW